MDNPNRREWILTTGAVTAAMLLPGSSPAADTTGFTLPPLPYAFDALEPHIDSKTMEIHHDRHHKAYVDNLNKALAGTEWANKSIEDVLGSVSKMPADIQENVTNNAGGHYNHSLFWTILGKNGGKPSEELLKAWGGPAETLQKAIAEVGMRRFGSGWSWAVYDVPGKRLKVVSTANQDVPLSKDEKPIFGVDVWEHAYYLKYQNKRADYLTAIWNVMNWNTINERFAETVKS